MCRARGGSDSHALQAGELDQYSAIDHTVASNAVPSAADGKWQTILACEGHVIDYIRCPCRTYDEHGRLSTIVDRADGVLAVVLWTYQLTPEARHELLNGCLFGHAYVVISPVHHNLSFSQLVPMILLGHDEQLCAPLSGSGRPRLPKRA
jgi:hypothetical protein